MGYGLVPDTRGDGLRPNNTRFRSLFHLAVSIHHVFAEVDRWVHRVLNACGVLRSLCRHWCRISDPEDVPSRSPRYCHRCNHIAYNLCIISCFNHSIFLRYLRGIGMAHWRVRHRLDLALPNKALVWDASPRCGLRPTACR